MKHIIRLKNIVFTLGLTIVSNSLATELSKELLISKTVLSNSKVIFVSHRGPQKFDNALAMNIEYAPVKSLRKPIEESIGRKLQFLTAWDPQGEAHLTVITPPEYSDTLSKYVTMDEIEHIALASKIQSSDIQILGLGSGLAIIDGQREETFFIIVDSQNLRKIRHDIYIRYIKNGGSPSAWDPTWWFPHITIGYTKRDLHESDKVLKNVQHSWDKRFKLRVY